MVEGGPPLADGALLDGLQGDPPLHLPGVLRELSRGGGPRHLHNVHITLDNRTFGNKKDFNNTFQHNRFLETSPLFLKHLINNNLTLDIIYITPKLSGTGKRVICCNISLVL